MLVEDLRSDGLTETGEKMMKILKSAGIEDADSLKAILDDLRKILETQESLKRKVGGLIEEPMVRKRKKSGK